jgi:magnesium transporter
MPARRRTWRSKPCRCEVTAAPDPQTADAQEYGLPPGFVQGIEEALDDHRLAEVEERLAPLHSADLAALLEALHPDDRRIVVGLIRVQLTTDAEALAWLNEDVRQEVLDLLGPQDVAAALQELDSDDALALIETLDQGERDAVLANVPAEERRVLLEGLDFPEYSAGRLMQRELVSVPDYWTVGKTIDWLRTAEDLPDEFYSLFLVDVHGNPSGQLPLSRFLRGRRPAKLADLGLEGIHPIPAEMDQEEVALLFRRYAMVSAPVVDRNGKLLGVITLDDVVDVIDEEAEQDIFRLGGIGEQSDLYRDVAATTRSRFSWLFVNLLTAVLASSVIGLFEDVISRVVALAVLMPIVASMGGNAGTQTLTVAVRALAMRELTDSNAARILWKEVLVGVINGLLFAAIAGGVVWLWFGDPRLAVVIGAAMIINLLAAAFSGTVIPLAMQRFGIDPAVSSAVFLTTVTDVVGFFAFLGLAALILL